MPIAVLNNTIYNIDTLCYKKFLHTALHVANINGDVSLVFVNDKYMKKLNKEYRDKNKSTDVLTFANEDKECSGDIIISYEWVIKRYKEERQKRIIKKLIIHSILHLKGIHHDYSEASLKENYKKMNTLYKDIINYKKTKILKRSNFSSKKNSL